MTFYQPLERPPLERPILLLNPDERPELEPMLPKPELRPEELPLNPLLRPLDELL